MTTSAQQLKKIAALAYLETDEMATAQLAQDVSAIMAFVETLRQVNTKTTAPLLHPLDLSQRLRHDQVTESNNIQQLANIAPLFNDDLFLVPKVIETGK